MKILWKLERPSAHVLERQSAQALERSSAWALVPSNFHWIYVTSVISCRGVIIIRELALEFVDDGHDIFVGVDRVIGAAIRQLTAVHK